MGASDRVRRAVDVVIAVGGLFVLSPLLVAAGLAVRLSLGPGVIFLQERTGQAGKPFMLLKFRTMQHPKTGETESDRQAQRITRVGAFLRSSSIDELPSLVNLLRGEISLVGPRPLPTRYWDRYRGEEYRRFEVKPGLTGLAQISGRNLVDWPERLGLDVEYVETRSLGGDLRIVLRTIPVVLRRSGISHGADVTMHELPQDRP